jgi:TonB family protein
MFTPLVRFLLTVPAVKARLSVAAFCAALALAFSASSQQPDAVQQPTASSAQSGDTPQPATPSPPQAATPQEQPVPPLETGGITEAELKHMLVGKALYLRDGYLDNSLSFNEHGHLIGHSPHGSYTLSAIQIDRVRVTKHKVTLEGARYGLHFLGQLASEDSSSAFDRVRITPNKKVVKITIDREMVVKPKKIKGEKEESAGKGPTTGDEKNEKERKFWRLRRAAAPAAEQAQTAPPQAADEMSEADQLKASIAATPVEERPADAKSVTTTTSPAHAMRVLQEALDNVFAQGLDERMMASLPDFWKLYYQAAAAKADYRPKDPAVLRQNSVDQKARLLTQFEPDSNEFAQANGVAGMAQYHAVVRPDGTVGDVVVSRPIGFGLDENAVEAIRKAKFEPAIKDGKPVSVMLNLNVPFRIFSKMTNVHAPPEEADKPAEPVLPGPYSVPKT